MDCLPRPRAWFRESSPHDKVVAIHFLPIARAPEVARVPHHSTAPALLGVPEAVGVLTRHDLEQLLQHLVGVVRLELGLQHLCRGDGCEDGETLTPSNLPSSHSHKDLLAQGCPGAPSPGMEEPLSP